MNRLSEIIALAAIPGFLCLGCQHELPSGSSDRPAAPGSRNVDSLLVQMTLDEKIGQMTQVDRQFLEKEEDIQIYSLGSLLSGGGSAPADNSPGGWANMYDRYQAYALQTRLQIPLIYGIDAVHGHNNVKGAVIFPHNIGLGCTRNATLVEQAERVTAEEVAGTGIDWTFSPVVAVPRNERWGRTYEGFGEEPELVRAMGEAAVRGYQTRDLAAGASILACAKHFVGDGATADGRDQGDTQISEATLRQIHLAGYLGALRANTGSIMVSFSSWNGQKMHGHQYLLTSVLKGELDFTGFLVSDWAGIDQLPGDYTSDVETSINAGLDMIMVPQRYKDFIRTLKTLVNQGRISMARIDDAVRRILSIKVAMGLFEHPYTDRALTASVGSAAHRLIARECVRQSLVLLKNNNHLLPLAKNLSRLHVAGKNADDLGNQCGGWTISWQGSSGNITTGTTILQAIKSTVSPSTTIAYSRDGIGAAGAEVGIVVIGETPYAEGVGDRNDLRLASEDMAAVVRVKNTGVPVVTILISGRPLIVGPILDYCDALMAAWLPGTEGQGIADVLFGDYNPTGKLSHSWPRDMTQIPINIGDAVYDPLFPYGYGLSY
jgi:beta-glucosidase